MQVYADVVVVGPVTRTAAQSGAWNDPATWGGTVPAPGDDIVIPAGIAVALTNNPAIGNLTIAGTCNLGTNTLQISGNFTNTGTFTPGTGTVELTGGSNQVLAASAPGELTFYKLTVNKDPATNTVTATSKLKATKKLTLTKGKLISASDYGDVFIDTEGTLELTSDITVSGNFTNNGNFYNNDNGVTFDGGVEQNLSVAATTWFSRLTVTAGTTLIETETSDSVEVAQLSNLGVIRKTQAVDTAPDYYFGLAGNYGAGLEIDVTSLAGAAPLTAIQVDRVDSNPPNAPGTNVTGIYWTITAAGSDFTATVILPQDGLADPQVCRYRNSAWDWARSGFDATTVTRAGLTAFGEFAVFNDPQPTAAGTTNVVVSSSNPSLPGANVTFTATVGAVPPGSGIPTNQVCFLTNGIPAATNYLDATGQAAYSTALLPHGSNIVTAQYISDGNFLPSTNRVVQVVNTPPTASGFAMGGKRGGPATVAVIGGKHPPADVDVGDAATLHITAVTQGSHGTVSTDSTNVTYTGTGGDSGTDSFTYTVSDRYGGTAVATVTVSLAGSGEGFNLVSLTPIDGGQVRLTYLGVPGYGYALDRTDNLAYPIQWIPQATNLTDGVGQLIFTNHPDAATNNFWRTRYLP